ncbi:hypothetical protein SAMN02745146_0106 [Hymenobacter daecheongensis DSM 21074]|uniref:Baseplate J-like C-terminal domain-containing protein n=1 Tax=Hymenobacter daecheongensis DSM 21074 TaxID=1121955 RepID=A0A1M6LYT2_9BACT|nr:hypothetical protein [Hymenobacter daecheongensis]SHJ76354.1 hypothetical protein SAMN02745146_0106 [Hymenobacter daecheongensis DSM 21074]
MARSIPEISQSIRAALAAQPVLAGLNSPSATAIYKLLADVFATAAWAIENLFDRLTASVDAKLAQARPGTPKWYANQLKKFQLGDLLRDDETGIHYAPGSTGQRLISQATAKENELAGKLYLKVAATDAAAPGGLRSLTEAEMVQARAYLKAIQFPGMRIEMSSLGADLLRVEGVIYYDALLDLPTLKAAVRAAMRGYLATLDFDGQVYVARLEDAIQAVPGVTDLALTRVAARSGQLAATVFTRVYETAAGYITEDTAPGAGFLDTLTFIPNGTV